jgi:hypothetical protein
MIMASGLEDTRIGIVGGLILFGFIVAGILGVIFYVGYLIKGLTKKETRDNTVKEIRESAQGAGDAIKFIATDKSFHKEMKKEFRPQMILLAVIVITLLLTALGVDDY